MKQFLLLVVLVVLGATLTSSLPRSKSTRGQEPIGPIEFDCLWNGPWAFPDACDQFVECWDGQAVLWQCTDLMLFDLTYNGCNYAQYTHCEDRPRPTNVPSTANPTTPTTFGTTSNVSTTTTEGPPEDYDCPADGVFQHDTRCEYYWNCYGGVAQLIHCQSDFLFDLAWMGCNYPELTHCQDRTRPPGAKPTLQPPPTTMPTRPPTTRTPAPTGSTPEVEPTEEYTGSTLSPRPTTTTTTTENPGGEFQCPPGQEGDFPDPEDCSKFYTCVGGVPFHQSCPDGLHFNPAIDACDYPHNVNCEIGNGRKH